MRRPAESARLYEFLEDPRKLNGILYLGACLPLSLSMFLNCHGM